MEEESGRITCRGRRVLRGVEKHALEKGWRMLRRIVKKE